MKCLSQLLEITKKNRNKIISEYLKNREITKKSAIDWEIGYLSNQNLLLDIEDSNKLKELGILIRGSFSPLHEYLTFPLYDQYNRIIGISGRTLQSGKVKRKYWHSVIPKRRFLFGLNKAIEEIRSQNYVIVTEGQFDVIIAHQFDIKNIVGTMGTALGPDQINILSRYTNNIYLIFDNDLAGQKALESQSQRNKREGVNIYPIILPDKDSDVDSFIRKYGKQALLDILSKTKPI